MGRCGRGPCAAGAARSGRRLLRGSPAGPAPRSPVRIWRRGGSSAGARGAQAQDGLCPGAGGAERGGPPVEGQRAGARPRLRHRRRPAPRFHAGPRSRVPTGGGDAEGRSAEAQLPAGLPGRAAAARPAAERPAGSSHPWGSARIRHRHSRPFRDCRWLARRGCVFAAASGDASPSPCPIPHEKLLCRGCYVSFVLYPLLTLIFFSLTYIITVK